MINPVQLAESLRQTFIFRRRSLIWLSRNQKKLSHTCEKIEQMKKIPIHIAEKYVRNSVMVEVSILLSDFNLKSVLIDSENAPIAYRFFLGDDSDSVFGGKIND